jgi:hypothetical protein
MVEAGRLSAPRDSNPTTENVLDSPAKPTSFAALLQDKAGPKKAEKDPNNPEKPDRVRSINRKPRNS